jgi:hypothetical protein
MSHEVRALAHVRGRPAMGWGALLAGVLALLLWLSPSPQKPASLLPEGLPTAEEVERICLETALWTRVNSREPLHVCSDPRRLATREGLLSFVARLPATPPRLATIARLEDRMAAARVASEYQAQLERLRARSIQQTLRHEQAMAGERALRTALAALLGLAAFWTAWAWLWSRPVRVVVSIGRVVLGRHTVNLEQVARWDFSGVPSLTRTDGVRLSLEAWHALPAEDQVALQKAMEVAMGRVSAAAPLNEAALHAVRELAR